MGKKVVYLRALDAEGGPESLVAVGVDDTSNALLTGETGRGSQTHNRFVTSAGPSQATIASMTWTAAEEIYAVRFKVAQTSGDTGLTAGDLIRVVFDASPVDDTTDTAQAWAWLQVATSSESADVEYHEFPYIATTDASGGWSDWFVFVEPLRRADFLYPGGTATSNEVDVYAETA